MKTTMSDVAQGEFRDPKEKKIISFSTPPPSTVADRVFNKQKEREKEELLAQQNNWEQLEKDIQEYNDSVSTLDTDYANFEPFQHVIVRCYHKQVSYSTLLDGKQIIVGVPSMKIPTRPSSGSQTISLEPSNSPWVFTTEAVVVAVPEDFTKYSPGDVVQIHKQCVIPNKINHQEFTLDMAFTLPEWNEIQPPTNKKDKHYGYFMIDPYRLILGKINKTKK